MRQREGLLKTAFCDIIANGLEMRLKRALLFVFFAFAAGFLQAQDGFLPNLAIFPFTLNSSDVASLNIAGEGENDTRNAIEDCRAIRKLTAENITKLGMFDVLPFDEVDSFIKIHSIVITEIYKAEYYNLLQDIEAAFLLTGNVETVETKNESGYRITYYLLNIKNGKSYKSKIMSVKAEGPGITAGVEKLARSFFSDANLPPEDLQVPVEQPLYKVGDAGPAGGIIFYVKAKRAGTGGWRYLEAAPEDIASAIWGFKEGQFWVPDVKGTESAVGEGFRNTTMINARASQGMAAPVVAAQFCYNYIVERSGLTYDDWFLPSIEELDLMYRNIAKNGAGSFSKGSYWSSTQSAANTAWFETFNDGRIYPNGLKSETFYIRPVRAF